MLSKIRVGDPGSGIRKKPIPNPGVKKTPDPRSAILICEFNSPWNKKSSEPGQFSKTDMERLSDNSRYFIRLGHVHYQENMMQSSDDTVLPKLCQKLNFLSKSMTTWQVLTLAFYDIYVTSNVSYLELQLTNADDNVFCSRGYKAGQILLQWAYFNTFSCHRRYPDPITFLFASPGSGSPLGMRICNY